MFYYYTGLGSRSAPLDIQQLAVELSMHMRAHGWYLRTTAMSATDKAFAAGAGDLAEIYLPWSGWPGEGISSLTSDAMKRAKEVWDFRVENNMVDPEEAIQWRSLNWADVNHGMKSIIAQGVCVVLGRTLDVPSSALICWTPLATYSGYVAHSMVTAMMHNIPILNLWDYSTAERAREMLRNDQDPSIFLGGGECGKELGIYGVQLE